MMKKRLACSLAVGLAAVVLVSGCSSKDKQLASPAGSLGLLGTREIVPPPYGQPSDLKMLPSGDQAGLGKVDANALAADLKLQPSDDGFPVEPSLDVVDARLQSVIPPAGKSAGKDANGAFVPAPAGPVDQGEAPILDLGKEQESESAQPVVKQTYTVRRGDTLTRIAKIYGVTWRAIAMENKLSNGGAIKVGQVLTLPAEAKTVKIEDIAKPAVKPAAKAVKPVAKASTGKSRSSVKPLPQDGKYKVKSGDSLWRIADRYGLKINDIRRWNNLRTDMLQIDQVLILKGSAAKTAPAAKSAKAKSSKATSVPTRYNGLSGNKHIVKRGESLWTIARNYKVKQDDLMKWNGLKNTRLQINQVLLVKAPADSETVAAAPAAEVKPVPVEPKAVKTAVHTDVVDLHNDNAAVPVAESQAQSATVSPVPTAFGNANEERKPASYTVAPGETLDRLLQEKGIQIDEFRRLNPNIDTDKPLTPGTELMLPF